MALVFGSVIVATVALSGVPAVPVSERPPAGTVSTISVSNEIVEDDCPGVSAGIGYSIASPLSKAVPRHALHSPKRLPPLRSFQSVGMLFCSQPFPVVMGANSSRADGGFPSTLGVQAAVTAEQAFGSGAPNPVSDPRRRQSPAWYSSPPLSGVTVPMFVTVTSVW